MKTKVPLVLEADSLRPANRPEYDPFGNGSDTWRVWYFFRRRKNYKVGLYSSYGRSHDEAKLALVRAMRNDWLNAGFRTKTPGRSKIVLTSSYMKQFEWVPVSKFLNMCKRQGKRGLMRETLNEVRKGISI